MYANLIVKTKSRLVVTLIQAKGQCNVEADYYDDDPLFTQMIKSATNHCEGQTGIDIAETSNVLTVIDFVGETYKIDEKPYSSMTSIVITKDEVEVALVEGTDFEIKTNINSFEILFNEEVNSDKMIITFVTGYQDENIPYDLIAAILITVCDLYDNWRSSQTIGVKYTDNESVMRLLSAHVTNRW